MEIADGEYHPDHWWHKEIAVVDACWNYGTNKDKIVRNVNSEAEIKINCKKWSFRTEHGQNGKEMTDIQIHKYRWIKDEIAGPSNPQ